MNQTPRDVKRRIIRLAGAFAGRLPERDIEGVRDLAGAGEWGLALEVLATQIYEYDLVVSKSEYEEIAAIGAEFGVEERYWRVLTVAQ